MAKINYKKDGSWVPITASDVDAAPKFIVESGTENPNEIEISDNTLLYVDTAHYIGPKEDIVVPHEQSDFLLGENVQIATKNSEQEWTIESPVSIQNGGTGTTSLTQLVQNIIQEEKKQFFDVIYPIGSIYISVDNTSPQTLFGGTWEKIEGRFLLGTNSNYTLNSTGGAATVTLTAAQSGMPAHSHSISAFSTTNLPAHKHVVVNNESKSTTPYYVGAPAHGNLTRTAIKPGSGTAVNNVSLSTQPFATYKDNGALSGIPKITIPAHNTANATAKAATSAHTNMPPYIAVNIWKRTAL